MGLLALLVLVGISALSAIGGFYLKAGRQRSVDRLGENVRQDIQKRLESITNEVGGWMEDGPSLHSAHGVLTLAASRAPQSMVIDLARFTGPLATDHRLTVLSLQDAAKAIATRSLKPVTLEVAAAAAYSVLASDEAFARAAVGQGLLRHLEELDRSARVRARIQVAGGSLTVLAPRGLSKPEELKAFHDGSAAIGSCLQSAINASKV